MMLAMTLALGTPAFAQGGCKNFGIGGVVDQVRNGGVRSVLRPPLGYERRDPFQSGRALLEWWTIAPERGRKEQRWGRDNYRSSRRGLEARLPSMGLHKHVLSQWRNRLPRLARV
jgi:hypothetical protein